MNTIRQRRRAMGLSVASLARLTSYSASLIGQIERGVKYPSLQSAAAIARVLKTSIEELFPGLYVPQDADNAKSA